MVLTRFFTRNHRLNVETGGWQRPNKVPYEQRFCKCCTTEIEDEYHFIIICPLYEDIRKLFIKPYYRIKPSMYKFLLLCKTSNKSELIKLAKYITKAFEIRKRVGLSP